MTRSSIARSIVGRIRGMLSRSGRTKKRVVKWARRMKDPARRSATAWCARNATDLDAFARRVSADDWHEAQQAKHRISQLRKERLASRGLHGSRPSHIGGGPGNLALLHWLVRLLKPEVVVETGVASGASSRAILEGIVANGRGHLYSSDLAGVIPREFSGLCVDDMHLPYWTLFHDGDRANLEPIIRSVRSIDLVHYDSAKSAVEMQWVFETLSSKFSDNVVVVLDDIDRHDFFQRYTRATERSWFVFGAVGVIGLTEALAHRRLPT